MDITLILDRPFGDALAALCFVCAALILIGARVNGRAPALRHATLWEALGAVFYCVVFGVTLLWAGRHPEDPVLIRAIFRFELWGAILTLCTVASLNIWSAWRRNGGS